MAIQVKAPSLPLGPPANLERVPGQPGLLMVSARSGSGIVAKQRPSLPAKEASPTHQ